MIHFVPNMYVSGKISALRPGTQTVMIFGTTKKIRKLPKTTKIQDLRFFAGFFAFFLRGFAGFIPSRLMRCKHFLAFVSPNPKTCNQSPKIQDLGVLSKISRYISRYRSNSENTYIFLGFGGSRLVISCHINIEINNFIINRNIQMKIVHSSWHIIIHLKNKYRYISFS